MFTTKVVAENDIKARAAAKFVQTATRFKAKAKLTVRGKTVDAASILMVFSADIRRGDRVTINAYGSDEVAAAKALAGLLTAGPDQA